MAFLKRAFRPHGNGEEEQQSDGRQGHFNHIAVNDVDLEEVPRYPPPNHPFGSPVQIPGSSSRALAPYQKHQQEVSHRDREVLQKIERGFEQVGHEMANTIVQGHAGSFVVNKTRDGFKFKPEHVCFACNQYIEEQIYQYKFAFFLKCILFEKAPRRKLEKLLMG